MLELRNVSRIYKPKKGAEVRALDNISLTFGKTGMNFILGKSGSGKSTLLNVIGGLDKYDSGELIVKNKSTKDFKQSEFDSYRNTMIGFIFQEYNVLDEFSVAQNVSLAIELQGKKATNEKLNEILNSVDLTGYGNRKPNELSGGQKQRVAIARALVKDPQIIMADEPTGALDSETGKQVFETLKKLSKTRLVIVVSHDRDFAEKYGDRIIEFKDGQIISDVTSTTAGTEISNDSNLELKEDGISITKGYTLTTEDLAVINEYLKTKNKQVFIKEHQKKKEVSTESGFYNTDHSKIEKDTSNLELIKSKLPFRSSLKIGATALRHKTIRLIFSIILASVAFAMFGLTDAISSYNEKQVLEKSLEDSETDYISFSRVKDTGRGNFSPIKFGDEDLEALNALDSSVEFMPIYNELNNFYMYLRNVTYNLTPLKNNLLAFIDQPSGYATVKATDLSKYNLTLLAGTLPTNDQEVAFTKYQFDILKKTGFKNNLGSEVVINNYNDLVGLDFNSSTGLMKISGILDTKYDASNFEYLNSKDKLTLVDSIKYSELLVYMEYSLHNVFFIHKDLFDANKIPVISPYTYTMDMRIKNPINDSEYYVNQVSPVIEEVEIVYFKNVVPNNLGAKDLIIGMDELNYLDDSLNILIENYNILHGQEFKETYVSSKLTKEEMHPFVYENRNNLGLGNDYPEIFSELTTLEKNNLPTQYVLSLGYDYYRKPNGFSLEDLDNEVKKQAIKDTAPINIDFYYSENWGELEEKSGYRIVGVHTDSRIYNRLFVGELFLKDYKLDQVGYYDKAFSYNDKDKNTIIQKAMALNFKSGDVKFKLYHEVTSTLDQIGSLIETLSQIFLYVGIGFAAFAALLLINFIATSISYKKQEIGILRAIGARGKDVSGIFFKEATIIALINFTIALVGTVVAVILINGTLRNNYGFSLTILSFSIRQIGLMIGISLVVAYLSSAIPVRKVARKRPIDAIRDK